MPTSIIKVRSIHLDILWRLVRDSASLICISYTISGLRQGYTPLVHCGDLRVGFPTPPTLTNLSPQPLSMTGQQSGSEENITGLIDRFGSFIKDAHFELDKNGVEQCMDRQMKEKAQRLFKALGFEKEVTLPL